MSTDGLKAELVNRLQARLDEEEFGLVEAPTGALPEAASVDTKSTPTTPSTASVPETPKAKKAEVPVEEPKPSSAAKPTTATKVPPSGAAKEPREKDEAAKEDSKAGGESSPATKVGDVNSMSFEEKKKMRAARFKMDVVKSPEKAGKDSSRKRSARIETKDKGREKKRQKTPAEQSMINNLSKDELEKRIERAKKYGKEDHLVDAMKARLRKYRFETTK